MKYFKILSLLLLTIFCFHCQKKHGTRFDFYNSFKSTIVGTSNDNSWKKNNWTLLGVFQDLNPTPYTNLGDSSTSIYCLVKEDRITLLLSQFNEQQELRETLAVFGISKKKGRFAVIPRIFDNCDIKDSLRVNFTTSTADGDVAKDFYDSVDIKNSNYLEITDFKSNQVKGVFDFKFIMTRRRDQPNAIYPDTLHLKGTFDIKK